MPRSAKKPTNPNAPNQGQTAAPVTQPRVQPITVPTGEPYGEAKALADAQRQLPVPGSPPLGAPSQPPVAGVPSLPGPMAGVGGQSAIDAATADTAPPVGLGNPTQRPSEPVTSGLPVGAGPGPEALGINQPAATSISQLLNSLANSPAGNSDIRYLASYVNGGRG